MDKMPHLLQEPENQVNGLDHNLCNLLCRHVKVFLLRERVVVKREREL
jgi:hypothetical protein